MQASRGAYWASRTPEERNIISLDLATAPFGSGMLRLALQSASLFNGKLNRCGPLLTLPTGGTSSLDSTTAQFGFGMQTLVLQLALLQRNMQSVAYSPDGWHIISGCSDCTIRIWDAETGAAIGTLLEGHTNQVLSVACSVGYACSLSRQFPFTHLPAYCCHQASQ